MLSVCRDHLPLTYPSVRPILPSFGFGAVDMLKGPLEADVLEASEACWTMDERNVQVKRAVTEGCSSCPALLSSHILLSGQKQAPCQLSDQAGQSHCARVHSRG